MLSINEETNCINITDNSSENLSKTLLAINRAYQEVIQEKIDKLKTLLRLNLHKQVIFKPLVNFKNYCKLLINNRMKLSKKFQIEI